ncbi:uncharacterized protein C8Q71DRAFT_692457, partial [Rhodofomes roseus]
VPLYVVGEATATALHPPDRWHSARPSKGNVHGAASTGTSEKLTRLNITQLTNVPPEEPCRALLNLTRDKNQDTFKHVRGAVEPVQVYETHGSATF